MTSPLVGPTPLQKASSVFQRIRGPLADKSVALHSNQTRSFQPIPPPMNVFENALPFLFWKFGEELHDFCHGCVHATFLSRADSFLIGSFFQEVSDWFL